MWLYTSPFEQDRYATLEYLSVLGEDTIAMPGCFHVIKETPAELSRLRSVLELKRGPDHDPSAGKADFAGFERNPREETYFGGSGITYPAGRGRPMLKASYGAGPGSGIPLARKLLAGREVSDSTRSQVYGAGSDYLGTSGNSAVKWWWAFLLGLATLGGASAVTPGPSHSCLYPDNHTSFSNTSWFEGALYIQSNSTSTAQTIFRIVAENSTIINLRLFTGIVRNCSTYLPSQIAIAVLFNRSVPAPKPEQVIQFYHISSVALTLDGYNSTTMFASEGTGDMDLPYTVDIGMINCFNQTIAVSLPPLIDGCVGRFEDTLDPRATAILALAGVAIACHVLGLVWLYIHSLVR
ncbi:hypothetical protein L218DRAFT_1003669 [Marasmius fiardii PR-910]|nr:hypothetical protein L218DRAFT_1003669 [Marasmius fiardii PR-910]